MLRDFRPQNRSSFALWAALVVASATASGCVQRRMTIRTNPPGAQVYVDNHEIGRTPVSTDFVYYGSRNIRLVKDGYETVTVKQPIYPPWYQIPGIDFFVETFSPFEIRDERNFNYEMQPLMVTPSETLLARAEELRRSTPPPVAAAVPTTTMPPAAVSPYATTPYPTTTPGATYAPSPAPGGARYAPSLPADVIPNGTSAIGTLPSDTLAPTSPYSISPNSPSQYITPSPYAVPPRQAIDSTQGYGGMPVSPLP